MLWVTWKAHGVMEQYRRHHFYENPSISAVLACHLADNYIKHDDSNGSHIAALERSVKSLSTQLDKLETPKRDLKESGKRNGKDKEKDKSGHE
jgi:hypothetical protein